MRGLNSPGTETLIHSLCEAETCSSPNRVFVSHRRQRKESSNFEMASEIFRMPKHL
jgi:hypothetical protein